MQNEWDGGRRGGEFSSRGIARIIGYVYLSGLNPQRYFTFVVTMALTLTLKRPYPPLHRLPQGHRKARYLRQLIGNPAKG